ncbi:hypothetical protein I4F81_003375 [Pyropia yezoensis]|uniref:Uncharacterized protein n=1 Tax=Pyropia yezoensis TaxID=2788 RepID=A0ACC3BT60_PYRYE|nr:hypothetical protein I4F81_003375 [Neopyropia yezoensis]
MGKDNVGDRKVAPPPLPLFIARPPPPSVPAAASTYRSALEFRQVHPHAAAAVPAPAAATSTALAARPPRGRAMHLHLVEAKVHWRGKDDAPTAFCGAHVVLHPVVGLERRVVPVVLVVAPRPLTKKARVVVAGEVGKEGILVIKLPPTKLARRVRPGRVRAACRRASGAPTAIAVGAATTATATPPVPPPVQRVKHLLTNVRLAVRHTHITQHGPVGGTDVGAEATQGRKAPPRIDHPRVGCPHGRVRRPAGLPPPPPPPPARRGVHRLGTRNGGRHRRVRDGVPKPTRRARVGAAGGQLLPPRAIYKPHVHGRVVGGSGGERRRRRHPRGGLPHPRRHHQHVGGGGLAQHTRGVGVEDAQPVGAVPADGVAARRRHRPVCRLGRTHQAQRVGRHIRGGGEGGWFRTRGGAGRGARRRSATTPTPTPTATATTTAAAATTATATITPPPAAHHDGG